MSYPLRHHRPPAGSIRSVPKAAPELLRANDLFRPEYRDLDCELWDGQLIVHDGHGGHSGFVSAAVVHALAAHVRPRNLGLVGDCGTGFWLKRGPDRVLVPDASFISRTTLATAPSTGWVHATPGLIAEVRSPGASRQTWIAKGGIWIAHGVKVMWLVDPEERQVITVRPHDHPMGSYVLLGVATEEADERGSISGAPVLPDLTIRVADLFRALE